MGHWEKTGKSDEWYTPPYVFDALGCVFDMDVAAPREGPPHVPATEWLWRASLEQPWRGFVWMNPPFGGRNAIAPWMRKFFEHGNGVALTPDRTSAPWFREAWERATLVLFTPKIKFERADGSVGPHPSNGTALWAAGPLGEKALRAARDAGLGVLAAKVND